jgi:hypothetical protein
MTEECYLNSEDIPPLSELDHKQKNCFCYLCTCGLHKCPSLSYYSKPSPKVSSSYQSKFSKKQASPPKPFSFINELLASKQKMDLTSTNKADFKPFKVVVPKVSHSRYRSTSPFRLNATSTYSKNYLDYGPIEKKNLSVAVSSFEPIPFMATSTYAQNFVKHGKVAENLETGAKRSNILGAGGISILETTNMTTYKNYRERILSKPFVRSSLEQVSESASPHMMSTYAASFFECSPVSKRMTLKQVEKFGSGGE